MVSDIQFKLITVVDHTSRIRRHDLGVKRSHDHTMFTAKMCHISVLPGHINLIILY